MSTGAGVWRQAIARAAHARTPAPPVAVDESVARALPDSALTSLVRHLFFASVAPTRKRVFFAATDNETPISGLCERIGRTVAEISGGSVALVKGASVSTGELAGPQQTQISPPTFEYSGASQLGENLWSVPVELFQSEFRARVADEHTLHPFDYTIFGGNINDSAAPLFCRSCDGAVLVIAANQTRREAALRAKEILLSWNVELLGAVLDNRTFPVPESIYRRL